MFSDDGAIYKEEYTDSFRFSYTSRTDIEAMIYNQLYETLKTDQLRDFYYSKFFRIATDSLSVAWYSKTSDTNQSTGYIGEFELPYQLGTYTSTNLRFVTVGALLKFTAPPGYYFDKSNNNAKTLGTATVLNSTDTLWVKVISVIGDGTNGGSGTLDNGQGTVILNDIIPQDAVLSELIPAWKSTISTTVISTMVD